MDTDDELKIWIAVRRDLNMPAGKLVAQAGHAAASAIWQGEKLLVDAYMAAAQPKIAVSVKDEAELLAIVAAAREASIPAHAILDAGRTIFTTPTYTVAAIGPARRADLPPKVRRLRLMAEAGAS